jgi:hypothetical protein
VLVKTATWEADTAVAVAIDTADDPNCGMACAKPVSERSAARGAYREKHIWSIDVVVKEISKYQD